ncbi:OLC1v1000184C2 [Oldenlandia corymbosa var. corymbosa]|uniref:OLC1v1000184C2 n=1 Tax=Oldenlandia corymbosa var. corymbosa TaxID=529605 RepID=A0AAV1D369_OLDCO|nr:OLC1v1000184C2 [Oldenlandia corymbosa var. corymbosa]
MSTDSEARSSLDKDIADGCLKFEKGLKIRYTRDFLLSLSELECCKKLPSGFDQSLLSEFEDTSHGIHDRLRTHSSLPTQGFRRTEYGSSPPTRGDSGNYSRPVYGRWDSRSSGRSDRDSDSQSDRESDSGRRYGNQPRKSWQGPEHDGLLGSGSFPRPSGYSAGVSAPKVRSNDQYHHNRSNEPYHPPRPYKAAPLSRRDTDSYNDETFGSTDSTNEDRVEEERRRRASFELMRKEQTKALQEKQKPNVEKHKVDSILDVLLMPDDVKEEKMVINQDNELDATSNPNSIDPGKSASHSQAPYRPLVPPGFKSSVVDKTSGLKSLFPQGHSVENGSLSNIEGKALGELNSNDEPKKSTYISNKDEQSANSSLLPKVASKKMGVEDFPLQNSIVSEAHEALNEPDFLKVSGLKLGGELKENNSTSILDKIFANTAANVNISVDSVENHANKPEDSWSPKTVPSSKFARWFAEEEGKSEDERSNRPTDLLSLIVGSEKSRNQVDIKPVQPFPAEFPGQGPEIAKIVNVPTPNTPSTANGVSETRSNGKNQVVPAILTCEDLEQTILSEYGDKSPKSELHSDGWSLSGMEPERPRARVDSDASQHLLSLLQKGASIIDTTSKITPDVSSEFLPATYNTGQDISKDIHTPGESLTLETLFGSAFMKELKSVEAPVSAQRGSVGSSQVESLEPHGLLPLADNGLFTSNMDQVAIEKMSNEKNMLASNRTQQVKVGKTEKWLGYDDPQIDPNLSNHQAGVNPKHGGLGRSAEYRLPEEESLIADEDLNAQFSRLMPGRNLSRKQSLVSNGADDLADKLAAMAARKDERATSGSDDPFLPGSYNQIDREMPYRDLHAKTSSSHIHSMQMGHGRPVLHPLDSHPSHMDSQMKFVGRESMMPHEALATQQFPGNMGRPPFSQPMGGLSGFDHPAHHQILQQMAIPGSFPPHLVNDFPRGAPVPHLGNQTASFMQEINSAQGHPYGSHHPNVRGVGMPSPGEYAFYSFLFLASTYLFEGIGYDVLHDFVMVWLSVLINVRSFNVSLILIDI